MRSKKKEEQNHGGGGTTRARGDTDNLNVSKSSLGLKQRIRAEMEEKEKEEALALRAEQREKKTRRFPSSWKKVKLSTRDPDGNCDQRTNFRASTDGEEIVEGCQNHGSLRKSYQRRDGTKIEQSYKEEKLKKKSFSTSFQNCSSDKRKRRREQDIVEKKRLQKMTRWTQRRSHTHMLRRVDEIAAAIKAEQSCN